MSRRAHLYTTTQDFSKIRDVGECKNEVPYTFMMVLGVETKICRSQLWSNYEPPIAIKANFEKGLQLLYNLYQFLETQEGFDKAALAKYQQETKDFFIQYPDRVSELFFLEAGELFDIPDSSMSIEEQNRSLYYEIKREAEAIEALLSQKEPHPNSYEKIYWLELARNDIKILDPNWKSACYYSLNTIG